MSNKKQYLNWKKLFSLSINRRMQLRPMSQEIETETETAFCVEK